MNLDSKNDKYNHNLESFKMPNYLLKSKQNSIASSTF